ncbi:MAG TPA: glycogen-binding domain-containing protein, partial [Rhodothermales bacterium]
RLERARCSDQPLLASQPALQFDLEREQAFFPEAADYFLDVSTLRASHHIESTDLTTTPYTVRLEPDLASFPGRPGSPLLNGQPVISAVVPGDADVFADYASVVFTFVPPENEPLDGDLLISGSFNNWQYDPQYRMQWDPADEVYRATLLLKQGQYEYRYFSPDRRLRQILANAAPRAENLYMAFVYFSDTSVSTDRLLGVGGTFTR